MPSEAIEPLTYSVSEAAALLGVSRSLLYECVATGEVESIRFRSRIRIPASAVENLVRTHDRDMSQPGRQSRS